MTAQEIDKTIGMLRYKIDEMRHTVTSDDKIGVRMGSNLFTYIEYYAVGLVTNYADRTQQKTFMGYPVEIDYKNPMSLAVLHIEDVPVYSEVE